MLARAGLRRRIRSLLALAMVVGLVSGAVLALLSGARRTVSAVDRLRAESLAADLLVVPFPVDDRIADLRAHPDVAAVGQRAVIYGRVQGSDVDLAAGTVAAVAVDDEYGRSVDRPRLLAGSIPGPGELGSVMLTEAGAATYGARVGDVLVLESLTPAQVDRLVFAGEAPATFDGPTIRVEVAAVVRSLGESLVLNVDHLLLTPAFWRQYGDMIGGFDNLLLVRARDDAAVSSVLDEVGRLWADDDELFVDRVAEEASGVEDLARVNSLSLAVAAAVVLTAGCVIVAQALSRTSRALAADSSVLSAIGMTPPERLAAMTLPLLAAITVGAAVGAMGAGFASAAFPTGSTGHLEPTPGLRVDWPVLAGGMVVTVVGIGAAGAVTARRAGRPPIRRLRVGPAARAAARGPAIASAAGYLGTRAGVPARPALAGAILVLAAAVGAVIFGASLQRFIDDRTLDGWNWDVEVGIGDQLTDIEARAAAQSVADDPAVAGVALTRQLSHDVDGRELQVYGLEPIEGSVGLTVIEGRLPTAIDEVALGRTTAMALGGGLGDDVVLADADGLPTRFTVTGWVRFPNIGRDAPSDGVLMTLNALDMFLPRPDDGTLGFPTLLVKWSSGADTGEATSRLATEHPSVSGPTSSSQVLNMREARAAPSILVLVLAVLGLAAVAHALQQAVRLGRQDLGVLTAIGFHRRQRILVVAVQALFYVAAGVALGIPLGIVAGRSSWRLLAERLGTDVDPVVPATVALVVPIALVLVVVATVLPALTAARLKPGSVLAVE
jgi:hypothetical protein